MMARYSDEELQKFGQEIALCLVIYGGLTEEAAQQRVDDAGLCKPENNKSHQMLFHEEPYFWAMTLLHARTTPYWWNDIPGLWPPPEELYHPDWPDNVLKDRQAREDDT